MSAPKLSIVMPVYNGARYISATLESIKQQTFADFELIVVDDGSVDRTPEILGKYASSDTRFVIVTIPHLGIVAALNTGISKARSDLIVRIDADDIMAPSRLDRQLAFMNEHPELGGAGSYYRIIDENGNVCGSHEPPLCSHEEVELFIKNGGQPVFPHPTMILRRSVVQSLGGYREQFRKCEDVDLFVRMIQAGSHVLIQPEYLTYFRYHSASETARNVRTQYHLAKLIFKNFHLHRMGKPQITIEDYKADLAKLSAPGRLAVEAEIMSAVLLRRRDMAFLQGRRLRGMLLMAGAAILNPPATILKVKRRLVFFRARRLGLFPSHEVGECTGLDRPDFVRPARQP